MKSKMLFIIATLFLSNIVFASHQAWTTTKIKTVIVHDNGSENFMGEIHVVMPSALSSKPSCSTSTDRFIIDMSRPLAVSQYSTVLSTYIANKPITVFLNDFCNSNVATLRNIILGAPD